MTLDVPSYNNALTDAVLRVSPMTWSQEDMWFTHIGGYAAVVPADTSYNNLRLLYPLPDASGDDIVIEAVTSLIKRHEVLRSTFCLDGDGRPVQVVRSGQSTSITVSHSTDERARDEHILKLRSRPFYLEREYGLRCEIIYSGSSRVLVLVVSHVCTDGTGIGILRRDFDALVLGGSAKPTLPHALQPHDVAAFEQSEAGLALNRRACAFWSDFLEETSSLQIRTLARDRARLGFCRMTMDSPVMAAILPRLMWMSQSSASGIITAIYHLALLLETDTPASIVSVPFSNRTSPALRSLVGNLFGETWCALRIEKHRHISDLFNGLTLQTLEAFKHGRYCTTSLLESSVRQQFWQAPGNTRLMQTFSREFICNITVSSLASRHATHPSEAELALLPSLSEYEKRCAFETRDSAVMPLRSADLRIEVSPDNVNLELDGELTDYSQDGVQRLLRSLELISVICSQDDITVGELFNKLKASPKRQTATNPTSALQMPPRQSSESIIQDHPAVLEARIAAEPCQSDKRHESGVVAHITVDSSRVSPVELHSRLVKRCNTSLPVLVPDWYRVYSLPPTRSASASAGEWSEARLVDEGSGRTVCGPSTATSEVELEIAAIMKDLCGLVDLDFTLSYLAAGGKQLLIPALLERLRDRYSPVHIDVKDFVTTSSLRDLALRV